jgi:4-hydroxy-tetrahydrodipicolinate reductase
MGERLVALLAEHGELALAAALERPGHPALGRELAPGVRLGENLDAALASAEVAIVFANPAGSLELVRRAALKSVPCVVGTTGFRPEEKKELEALAARIPIVLAANFSVAVNVLFHLAREASRRLGPGYDAEIVELHHAAKVDAPSGTALRLAEAIAEGRIAARSEAGRIAARSDGGGASEDGGRTANHELVLAREGATGPRARGSVGVMALRGGDNPGEHTAYFIGRGERLELVHRSATRDHFAAGALRAAAWLLDRRPGLYDMEQVLGLARA